jgi:hypothetical protein
MIIDVVVKVVPVRCLYPPSISKVGEVTKIITESITT